MPPVKTRPCTEVYLQAPPPDRLPEFVERSLVKVESFPAQRVKGRPFLTKERLRVLIDSLIQNSLKTSARHRKDKGPVIDESAPMRKVTFKDKVNAKRRLIAACLSNQQVLNLAKVAQHTKSCYSTVQRVYQQMLQSGAPEEYNYNHIKPTQEVRALEEDIELRDGGLGSVADIKRRHPRCSRKFILRCLHSRNLRWRKLPLAEPKVLTYPPPSQTLLDGIIGTMAQVHSNPQQKMLFVDEIKFPLLQTSKCHWIHKDKPSSIKLNRREVDNTILTAIVLCSTERFLAVQLYSGEVTGPDFVYFMSKALASLVPDKQYLVLADNATWHTSSLVRKTAIYPYLYLNAPRMYQLNLIENSFSAVRAEFRKRETVSNIREEADQILNLFFSPQSTPRFAGYFRNHLRMLRKYLK